MDEQLFAAIAALDLPQVEALLAAGANPNASQNGKTAYEAVPHKGDAIKAALIEAGAEDPDLKHALVWVISTERTQAVRTLIAKGADVNVKTHSGTPIQVAARQGHSEIVDLLIAAGADVDAGSSISTPLVDAIEAGHAKIALKLIAAGANPNTIAPLGSHSKPLAIAAAQGLAEVIRALVAAGAAVNERIPHIVLNQLALQQATRATLQTAFQAMESLGQIFQSLDALEPDAEVPGEQVTTIEGGLAELKAASRSSRQQSIEPETAVDTTPVIIAARCGHGSAVAALLELGADGQSKDGEGLSAYDWAVRHADAEVLAVLSQFGIEATQVSPAERLVLAAENGEEAAVNESLTAGASVNSRDSRNQTRGCTALMLAAKGGHLSVIQTLLAAGADVSLTDQGPDAQPLPQFLLEHAGLEMVLSMGYQVGRTALMLAVIAGHLEICQVLLQAGSDPNQTDAIHNTALALAVEQNQFEIVQALVAAGANVNQVVADRNTAFLLACSLGAVEIGEFLIAQGASAASVNSNNETSLIRAAAAGCLPLVQLCLTQDVDVNAVGNYPGTALATAVDASRRVQVDPDDRSSGSRSREYRDDGSCWEDQPLSEAEIMPITQLLLSAGADPNIPNCWTTPLIAAAQQGHLNLLELLLAAGARLDITNDSGDTPVSMAQLYDQHRVLTWLRNYTGTDLSEFAQARDDDEDDRERWGEELPRPDFSVAAQSPDYQQAVQELGELCGSQPTEFDEVPGWYSVHVDTKRRASLDPAQIQRQFLERGYFVYMPDHYHQRIPERFCILPTTDKYEVIALHQTNGCNCGIGPSYVVSWLQELETEQPFTLTCIAHDTLAGKFLTPVADPDGWAEQMYEFCPDIVSQGCGSVERLAESLASSDNLYFWWD